MTPQIWRMFFWVAAVFNFLAGLPPLLAPTLTTISIGMPAPDPQYIYIVQMFGAAVSIFGIGYALVALGQAGQRQIITLGLIGKIGVVALLALRTRDIEVPQQLVTAASGDFLFSIGFAVFLFSRATTSKA